MGRLNGGCVGLWSRIPVRRCWTRGSKGSVRKKKKKGSVRLCQALYVILHYPYITMHIIEEEGDLLQMDYKRRKRKSPKILSGVSLIFIRDHKELELTRLRDNYK